MLIHRELLLLLLNVQFVYYIRDTTKMLLVAYIGRFDTQFSQTWRKLRTCFVSCCVIYILFYREWLTSCIRRIQYGHDNTSFHSLFITTIQVAAPFAKQCLEWFLKAGRWEGWRGSDVRNKTSSIVTVTTQCDSLVHSFTIMEDVPLATEPGISLIILTQMKILQRGLNRGTFVVWEMKRNVSVVCVCSAPNCWDTEQRSASQPASIFPAWRASLLISLSFVWGCLHNTVVVRECLCMCKSASNFVLPS
jgi:hypothetical protein